MPVLLALASLHRTLDALVRPDDRAEIECAVSMSWTALRPPAGVKKSCPSATTVTGDPAIAAVNAFWIAMSSDDALMSYR